MRTLTQYIFESQYELYHFTTVNCLLSICEEDTFESSSDDGYNIKGYDYYLSTTRQRNTFTGYTTGMLSNKIVRIVLDGTKLNKFKITPIDWGKAKNMAIRSNWPAGEEDFDRNLQSIMLQTNVECEDRVLLKTDKLTNFHNYIKEIQLDNSVISVNDIKSIQQYCDKYDIKLTILDHKKFMYGR